MKKNFYFLSTGVLLLGLVITWFVLDYYQYSPKWVLLLAFIFPYVLTTISFALTSKSLKAKGMSFMKGILQGFYLRFFVSFIFLGTLGYFYKSLVVPLVVLFFISYILFLVLEIKNLLYTLRADSEKQ